MKNETSETLAILEILKQVCACFDDPTEVVRQLVLTTLENNGHTADEKLAKLLSVLRFTRDKVEKILAAVERANSFIKRFSSDGRGLQTIIHDLNHDEKDWLLLYDGIQRKRGNKIETIQYDPEKNILFFS